MSLSSPSIPLLIDAHVHLHDCFDFAHFLDAAKNNFQKQSDQLDVGQPVVGVLMLAEVSGVKAFSTLVSQQKQLNQQLSDWKITPTEETTSLRVTHDLGMNLLIMAGRQVITQENIEVLTLVTDTIVEDGLSLENTLASAIALNSLPVLPWGAGKWLDKRGQIVKAQLAQTESAKPSERVFVGDNGGRPSFWPLPDFCKHHRNLPGTDPLPLSYEVNRPGSFGCVISTPLNWARPGEYIKQVLRSPQSTIRAYGRSQSPWKFVQNQLMLRLK